DVFFQAEDGIRDFHVTGVQTCALPISQLNLVELAAAAAEQHEVCRRPLAMLSTDPDTNQTKYVPAPCKSTLECVCPACAARAREIGRASCRGRVGVGGVGGRWRAERRR